MLKAIIPAATATTNTDKTVAIRMSNANTIYYTVPVGRKFVGYFTSTSVGAYLIVNGEFCLQLATATATQFSPPQITLLAGDTVASAPTEGRLLGIESDL